MILFRVNSNLPGNLRELVCSSFFGELPSWRLFAAGEASLLAGVDLTACITPWFPPPCISASCGSDDSCTEHLRRNFRQRWLMLLFHRFRSEKKINKFKICRSSLALIRPKMPGVSKKNKEKRGRKTHRSASRPSGFNDRKHLSLPCEVARHLSIYAQITSSGLTKRRVTTWISVTVTIGHYRKQNNVNHAMTRVQIRSM